MKIDIYTTLKVKGVKSWTHKTRAVVSCALAYEAPSQVDKTA
jgi:hypothetical protein